MRWEERAALRAAQQIEAQEKAAAQAQLNQKARSMREVMLQALPIARDNGLSATELSDAWSIPRHMIVDETDRVHRERKYT